MRFFKLFFSRLLIVGLAIIIQLGGYFFLLHYLETRFAWVSTMFTILGLLVALKIVDHDEPSSYKLPWILLVVLAPFVGVTLYSFFGRKKLTKKMTSRFEDVYEVTQNAIPEPSIELKKNIMAYGQSQYIFNACRMPAYSNCYSRYLSSGEVFFEALKEELNKAKKYIFFEYFIIEKGKMWDEIHQIFLDKIKKGVKVYLMYDDIGCASKIPGNFYKKLRKEGIDAVPFNKFIPIVSTIHNHRDHRKITVIDGLVAFTGGINIADEYINLKHPFGKWKDGGVMIKGPAVDSYVALFLQNYNVMTTKQLFIDDFISYEHEAYESKGFLQAYGSGPKPIFKENIGLDVYLNIINQAKKYLYITTPYLICDYSLLEALVLAKRRGVDVKLITPHIPDKKTMFMLTRSNYKPLLEAGIEVYEYKPGFIHTKMFVCDDEYALNIDTNYYGTFNESIKNLFSFGYLKDGSTEEGVAAMKNATYIKLKHRDSTANYDWMLAVQNNHDLIFYSYSGARVGYLSSSGSGGKINTTITHNAPIVESLNNYEIGSPVFMSGHVYRYGEGTYVEETTSTDCISSVKSTGTYKEFLGIVVNKHKSGDKVTIGDVVKYDVEINQETVDFATHGDYYFRVDDSSKYKIGDTVLYDGSIVDDDVPITNKIIKSTIGSITGIINEHYVSVFKS